MPLFIRRGSTSWRKYESIKITVAPPAPAEMVVVNAARAAKNVRPPARLVAAAQLNPYQPNHRKMVPRSETRATAAACSPPRAR